MLLKNASQGEKPQTSVVCPTHLLLCLKFIREHSGKSSEKVRSTIELRTHVLKGDCIATVSLGNGTEKENREKDEDEALN